ncbi:hypothetical protein [Terrimonas alba]|uniref:hypothetical protein n=1 Tax=Terrimonas alba TaxID=3349636 RepID=UPI0035F3B264
MAIQLIHTLFNSKDRISTKKAVVSEGSVVVRPTLIFKQRLINVAIFLSKDSRDLFFERSF